MTRLTVALLSFSVSIVSFGCSSSSTAPSTPTDSGADVSSDAVIKDTNPTPDTTPADTAPAACWLAVSGDPTVQKCYDCSQTKCKADRETAFGSGYLSGTFGGTCKDFAACACKCSEGDNTCISECKITAGTPCEDALKKVSDCENAQCPTQCAP